MLESVLKASMIFKATYLTKEYKWHQCTYFSIVLQQIISKVNCTKIIEEIGYGTWTEDFRAAVKPPGNIVVIG